jgi:endonuclease III
LQHNSAWELLVATILSAQSTDVRVNMVTPELFRKYPTVEDFAVLTLEQLQPDVRSTGFFRNKSKSVVGAAKKIVSDFGGQVPDQMEQLLTLPGVARKTANVVLGTWFRKNEGLVVDTHVHRISRRLELTRNDDPKKIEQDLMKIIPRDKSSGTDASYASPAGRSARTARWKLSATPPTRPGARWRSTSMQSRLRLHVIESVRWLCYTFPISFTITCALLSCSLSSPL